MGNQNQKKLSQKQKNQIIKGIRHKKYDHIIGLIHELDSTDIASLLESLKPSQRVSIVQRLSDSVLAKALIQLPDSISKSIIEGLEDQQIQNITNHLETDDLVELVGILEPEIKVHVLSLIEPTERKIVEEFLSFPENSCGQMMNTDFITIHPDALVGTVKRYLKFRAPLPQNSDTAFVVDDMQNFVGSVKLTQLFTADPSYEVRLLLEDENYFVHPETSQDDLIQLFVQNNLLSVPVVNAKQEIVGRITADDVLDILNEKAQQTLVLQGVDTSEDVFGSVLKNTKKRMLWLGINLITALLASLVIKNFEATIESIVAIAVLLPIIASMGGIAGSQTLIVTIRGITSNNINISNVFQFVRSEITISFLNAVFWAFVVWFISYIWFGEPLLALIAGISIVANIIFGAIGGVAIPWVMKKLDIDPALAGSVVLTTVTDIVGFFVLLSLGTLFLK